MGDEMRTALEIAQMAGGAAMLATGNPAGLGMIASGSSGLTGGKNTSSGSSGNPFGALSSMIGPLGSILGGQQQAGPPLGPKPMALPNAQGMNPLKMNPQASPFQPRPPAGGQGGNLAALMKAAGKIPMGGSQGSGGLPGGLSPYPPVGDTFQAGNWQRGSQSGTDFLSWLQSVMGFGA